MANDNYRYGGSDDDSTRYLGPSSGREPGGRRDAYGDGEGTRYLGAASESNYRGRPGADSTRYLGAAGEPGPQQPRQYIPPRDARYDDAYYDDAYYDDAYYDDGYDDYDNRDERGRDLRHFEERPRRSGGSGSGTGKVIGVTLAVLLAGALLFLLGRTTGGDGESTEVTTTEEVTSTERTTVTEEPTGPRFELPSELPSFDTSQLPELPEEAPTDEAQLRELWDDFLGRLTGGDGAQPGGELAPDTAG